MGRHSKLVGLIAGVTSLLSPLTADALLIRQSLAERAQAADAIVIGTVTHQESRWHERLALIQTDVTIRVEDILKAPSTEALPREVLLRLPGGRVGDTSMVAGELPAFRHAERVLVLLRRSPTADLYHLATAAYGMFRIVHDSVLQQDIVINDTGVFLADVATARSEDGPAPNRHVTLAQLRAYLKGVLNETTR